MYENKTKADGLFSSIDDDTGTGTTCKEQTECQPGFEMRQAPAQLQCLDHRQGDQRGPAPLPPGAQFRGPQLGHST